MILRGGGLSTSLVGVRETLQSLTMDNPFWISNVPYLVELAWLDKLTNLDLSFQYNKDLREEDMEDLSSLKHLTSLRLATFRDGQEECCGLKLPSSLFSLHLLRSLSLDRVSATSMHWDLLQALTGLTSLALIAIGADAAVVARRVAALGGLTGLVSLDLSRNAEELTELPDLGRLKRLRRLRCKGNHFAEFPAAEVRYTGLNPCSSQNSARAASYVLAFK